MLPMYRNDFDLRLDFQKFTFGTVIVPVCE